MREVIFADGRGSDSIRLDEGSVLVEQVAKESNDALMSLRVASRVRREVNRFQDPDRASGNVHQLAKAGHPVDQRLLVGDPVIQTGGDDDVLDVGR